MRHHSPEDSPRDVEPPPHLSIPKKDHYSLLLRKAISIWEGAPSHTHRTLTVGLGSLLSICGDKVRGIHCRVLASIAWPLFVMVPKGKLRHGI